MNLFTWALITELDNLSTCFELANLGTYFLYFQIRPQIWLPHDFSQSTFSQSTVPNVGHLSDITQPHSGYLDNMTQDDIHQFTQSKREFSLKCDINNL